MKIHGYIIVLYGILMIRTVNTEKVLGVEIEMKQKVVMRMDEKEVGVKFEGEKLLEQQAIIEKVIIFKNQWLVNVTYDMAGKDCEITRTRIVEEDCENTEIEHKTLRLQKELLIMRKEQVERHGKNTKKLEKFMWKYESIRLNRDSTNRVKKLFNKTIQDMIAAKADGDCKNENNNNMEYIEIGKENIDKLTEITQELDQEADTVYEKWDKGTTVQKEELQEVEKINGLIEECLKLMKDIIMEVIEIQREISEGKMIEPQGWNKLRPILGEDFMIGKGDNNVRFPWDSYMEMKQVVELEENTSYCSRIGLVKIPYYVQEEVGKLMEVKTELFMVLGVEVALHMKQRKRKVLEYDNKLYEADEMSDMTRIGNIEVYTGEMKGKLIVDDICYWRIKSKKIIEALMECDVEAYFMEELIFETKTTKKPYYDNEHGMNLSMKCGENMEKMILKKQGRIQIGENCEMDTSHGTEYVVNCPEENGCEKVEEIKEGVYNITESAEQLLENRDEMIRILREKLTGKETKHEEVCEGYSREGKCKLWNELEKVRVITGLLKAILQRTPGGLPTAWKYVPIHLKFIGLTFIGFAVSCIISVGVVALLPLPKSTNESKLIKGMRKYQKARRKIIEEKGKNCTVCGGCTVMERFTEDMKKYYIDKETPQYVDIC